jgi:hypothetical protein
MGNVHIIRTLLEGGGSAISFEPFESTMILGGEGVENLKNRITDVPKDDAAFRTIYGKDDYIYVFLSLTFEKYDFFKLFLVVVENRCQKQSFTLAFYVKIFKEISVNRDVWPQVVMCEIG